MKEQISIDSAIQLTIDEFPFKGYMLPEKTVKGAYSNTAETVMRHLPPGSKILDFGCGACDKTGVLQHLGFQCSACDDLQDDWHKIPGNREQIISFAKKCGIDFKLPEAGKLPFDKSSVDMVMLLDVIEHLHDSPRDLLNDVLELVRPDGLLFITVPNAVNIRKRLDVLRGKTNLPGFEGYYWYPGSWRGHVREYVRDDLLKLSEYLNLEVLELRACDHMLLKVPASIRPLYLFLTSIFEGWKDSWLLVAKKRAGWSAKKTLPQNELAKILGKNSFYSESAL